MPSNIWHSVARLLVLSGLALIALGGLALVIGRWGHGGRLLPGDIVIRRPGFSFYFPIVSCVVLSLLLSGVLAILSLLWRR